MPAALYSTDENSTAVQQVLCDQVVTSATLTTTNNSTQTILTIPTTINTGYHIIVETYARRTDSPGGWGRVRTIHAENDSFNTLTLTGSSVVSTEGATLSSGVSLSFPNILLSVTGAVGQTWNWKVRATIQRIT